MSEAIDTPRIEPGTLREIGLLNALVARVFGFAVDTKLPNVFTTIARHRRLFRHWLVFAGALMPGGKLPRPDTELVILRVAHLTGCAYEWDHHVRIGARAGLARADFDAVRVGPDAPAFSPRRAAILRATDELHHDRRVSDATFAALREHLSEAEIIELCMLVGHYELLAMTISTLGIQVDEHTR